MALLKASRELVIHLTKSLLCRPAASCGCTCLQRILLAKSSASKTCFCHLAFLTAVKCTKLIRSFPIKLRQKGALWMMVSLVDKLTASLTLPSCVLTTCISNHQHATSSTGIEIFWISWHCGNIGTRKCAAFWVFVWHACLANHLQSLHALPA